MSKIFRTSLGIALIFSSISAAALAQSSVVTVTRKAKNLYKVDGSRIFVKTKYCYQYGYGVEAAVNASSIVFIDDGTKCQVKSLLSETDIRQGSYRVQVSHEDDDLFSTLEGVYLYAPGCYKYSYNEEAVLRASAYGGDLIFVEDGKKCSVDLFLSKSR